MRRLAIKNRQWILELQGKATKIKKDHAFKTTSENYNRLGQSCN